MITDQKSWDEQVKINTDPYGKTYVDVARQVMLTLDEGNNFDCNEIISQADRDIKAGGITGFMAGCVAQIVSQCHSRGEEFRLKWNKYYQIRDEGDRANESGGILNPALLAIGESK